MDTWSFKAARAPLKNQYRTTTGDVPSPAASRAGKLRRSRSLTPTGWTATPLNANGDPCHPKSWGFSPRRESSLFTYLVCARTDMFTSAWFCRLSINQNSQAALEGNRISRVSNVCIRHAIQHLISQPYIALPPEIMSSQTPRPM